MIRAVVFDLDGTLTRPFLDFNVIREEIGAPLGRHSLLDQIDEMSPDEAARALAILERREREAVENAEANDGVHELLEYVRAKGLFHGIVTRNSERSTAMTLEKLGLGIERVITRDSGLPIKPDPAPFRALMDARGVGPDETLVVGDFRYDAEAGRAAGAKTCMVTNGREVTDDGGPDYKVPTPREVIGVLRELEGAA